MAQSLDPDFQSQQRTESPAGSILRRLFTFWQHEDDLAPEVAPQVQSQRRDGQPPISQAFTIWTSKASPAASVITSCSSGRLSYSEFKGFTLWATPRSEWPLVDERIQLPPSAAFTTWSRADEQAALAARWEKPPTISLPRSGAFTVWTTPGGLAALSDRWGRTAPIQLPNSQAFSTWTDAPGLSLLAARWDRPEPTPAIQLSDARPFSTWTRPEDLDALADRWGSAPDTPPIIRIENYQAFSIWTQPSEPDESEACGLIHLRSPQAHSIWTTLEGLAASSARWIPRDATAKVAPIPANFAETTTTRHQPDPAGAKITPFPSSRTASDSESIPPLTPAPVTEIANQNNMEDNSPKNIQLNDSKAFTLWSSPEHWKTNTIAASSAKASQPAEPAHADPAPAPLAAAPSPESAPPLQTADTAGDSSDTWKWAFILTLIGALGIIASQSAAIGTVKDDIEREISSREEVSKQLAIATSQNADLTDELTAKLALAETLSNEKVDLQAAMEEEAGVLKGTIDELKKQISNKASQLEGMGAAVASAKSENEAAAKKILALTSDVQEKGKSLDEMGSALAAAKTEASKLGDEVQKLKEVAAQSSLQAKQLGAKLQGSSNDQKAMAQELSAAGEALSASMKQIAELKAKLAELQSAPAGGTE